jgi:hypothetical protein
MVMLLFLLGFPAFGTGRACVCCDAAALFRQGRQEGGDPEERDDRKDDNKIASVHSVDLY